MDENVNQNKPKLKERLAKISKKVWAIIIGVVGVLLIAGIVLAVVLSSKTYTTLFANLSSEDMSAITAYLGEQNITDFKIQDNDTILVPEAQEVSLKAKLLQEGYPSSGTKYSMYLDHISALSTESDREALQLYDLQDRLRAIIRNFDNVKDATVNITPGSDDRFVLDRDSVVEAEAAVFVTMIGNNMLSDKQAKAIRNMVSHSVPGLVIENVSISDAEGNTYFDTDDVSNSDSAMLKLQLEEQVNNRIRAIIMQVLKPMYGEENVSIGVNSTVDVSRQYQESTQYSEPTWAQDGSSQGRGIIGKHIYSVTIARDGDTTVGGVVGTESNADISTYVNGEYQPTGDERQLDLNGEYDYDVSNTHTQTESAGGVVTDIMVAVSINSLEAGTINTDALITHIARAAGISADIERQKVSVIATPFYNPSATDEENGNAGVPGLNLPPWVIYAAIGGIVLFLILLIILILLSGRRKKKKQQQLEQELMAAEALAAAAVAAEEAEDAAVVAEEEEQKPEGADIMDVHTERSMELRQEVRRFAESNPEIAAQMLKSWLKGEGDENG